MGRTKSYERLAGLVAKGLVVHERGVPGHGVYLASREGLRVAGLALAPGAVSLGALAHDLAVAGVVARLESEMPGLRLLTERELRAHVHETGDQTFRPRAQQRGMRDARHWPDLVLLSGGRSGRPGWAAIEVELQRKGARRLQAILDGYRQTQFDEATRRLWGVLYLVPDAEHRKRVVAIGQRADLTADSTPVLLHTHTLDQPDQIGAAVLNAWATKRGLDQRERQATARHAEQRRRLDARQAAERAAREAAAEQRRQEQLLALSEAQVHESRRGIARLLGGSGR
jgi:hypothetical protein